MNVQELNLPILQKPQFWPNGHYSGHQWIKLIIVVTMVCDCMCMGAGLHKYVNCIQAPAQVQHFTVATITYALALRHTYPGFPQIAIFWKIWAMWKVWVSG